MDGGLLGGLYAGVVIVVVEGGFAYAVGGGRGGGGGGGARFCKEGWLLELGGYSVQDVLTICLVVCAHGCGLVNVEEVYVSYIETPKRKIDNQSPTPHCHSSVEIPKRVRFPFPLFPLSPSPLDCAGNPVPPLRGAACVGW